MMAISANGCGSMTETKGDVTERAYSMKADNPQVREFNKQLGEISSEATAERAVNSFVGYVDSRLDKSAFGMSVQSLGDLIGPDLIKNMAKKEAIARNVGGGLQEGEEGGYTAPLIDVGTITDNLNQLGSTEGIRINDEIVSSVQVAVEQSIPNINADSKPGMTPLEASVVAYTLVSGDDGTATQESVKLPADKIGAFVETITN